MSDINRVGSGESPRPVTSEKGPDTTEKKGESEFDKVMDAHKEGGKEPVKEKKEHREREHQEGQDQRSMTSSKEAEMTKVKIPPGAVVIGGTRSGPLQEMEKVQGTTHILPTAMIQQIAQKIIESLRVQTHAGQLDLKMSLDLGKMGQLQVQMVRNPDGRLTLQLTSENLTGQNLLKDHVNELIGQLEKHGLDLQTVRVQTPDGTGIDFYPGRERGTDQPIRPPETHGSHTEQQRQQDSQGQRKRGRERKQEPSVDEEEE